MKPPIAPKFLPAHSAGDGKIQYDHIKWFTCLQGLLIHIDGLLSIFSGLGDITHLFQPTCRHHANVFLIIQDQHSGAGFQGWGGRV